MKRERAMEISDSAFAEWEASDDSMQDAFTKAILAAAAEARREALTEAAKWAFARQAGCEETAKAIERDLLALRTEPT